MKKEEEGSKEGDGFEQIYEEKVVPEEIKEHFKRFNEVMKTVEAPFV